MPKMMPKIFALLLLLALSSCGSKRAVVQDYSSEEFILLELESMMLAKGQCEKALIDEAFSWKGVPYAYGGKSKRGTDCSGFVMAVFSNALGIDLPRNSAKQAQACTKINKKDLRTGDLVFFHTGKKKKDITHVGIYIGNGHIIHASSSKGVIVSNLEADYYKRTFHQAGRVPQYAAMKKKEKKRKK